MLGDYCSIDEETLLGATEKELSRNGFPPLTFLWGEGAQSEWLVGDKGVSTSLTHCPRFLLERPGKGSFGKP